jgi:transposase
MGHLPPRNRYYRRSHLPEAQFRQLLRLFALDLTATAAAELTGITRKNVNTIYRRLRMRLAEASARAAPWSAGDVEVDEAYLGARRVRGKPGRGAGGKTPVIGLKKRDGRVYADVVPNCTKAALQRVIRGKVPLDSVIHSDSWAGYDGLVDVGYAQALRSTTACATPPVSTRGMTARSTRTSTASRASGASPSSAWPSSTGWRRTPSTCTSKSASGASTRPAQSATAPSTPSSASTRSEGRQRL